MLRSRISLSLQVATLALLSGLAAPAQAQFNVAQYPLYVQQPVKPGFIMAVDDSGSMTFETLFPQVRDGYGCSGTSTSATNAFYNESGGLRAGAGGGGECNFHHLIPYPGHRIGNNRYSIPPILQFGFGRSPEINPSYYDPATEYRPWKRGDGSELPDASVTATRVNPRAATPILNVSVEHRDRTDAEGEDGNFLIEGNATYSIGTVFPAGIGVARDSACGGLPGTGGTNNTNYQYLTSPVVLSLTCNNVRLSRTQTGTPAADELFRVTNGTVLPAGTTYFRAADGACGGLATARPTQRMWVTLAAPHLMTQTCDLGIEYLPAQYYLAEATPVPAGFTAANRALAANACGAGCNMYRYEIRPGNYASPAIYAQQIQNFANWFSFYGNRNRAMVAGMTRALADVEFMRVGFFTINQRVDVVMNDLEIQTARDNLYNNSLLTLGISGSTPNRQAVAHLGEQFRRGPAAVNAVNPPQPVLNEANGGACQVNGGMLFTDGYSNQDGPTVGNIDGALGFPFADSNSNTLADIASRYYENTLQPGMNQTAIQVPASCASGTAEPWVDCKTFPHMNFYGVTLGATGNAYGVTHSLPPNDWREGYTNPPAWPPRENDAPSTVDDIWHASVNTRGRFINARTPEAITQAMRDVLLDVTSRARPAGGVASSGSRTGTGFLVYVPEYFSDDWTGDLKAYRLSAGGTLQTPAVWSASEILESVPAASRTIYASINSGAGLSLVPFTTAGLGGAASAQTRLGISAAELAAYGVGVTMDNVMTYLRGEKALEANNGGPLRSRRWKMGDILNSQPELSTASNFGYARLTSAEGGGATGAGSYGQYLTDKRAKPPVLFVGANDGMLHAIDSRQSGGDVLFSIIPNSAIPNLKELPKRGYQHRYFVDGTPVQSDVRIGSSWRTLLVSANGAGGKSVMALDVTNAATAFNPSSDFLWEFQNAGLGNVLNTPRTTISEGGTWTTFVANGVNSSDHRARLFLLNSETGAVLSSVVVGAGSAAAPNGLTSAIPFDTDFNGKADTVYAGDMQGNLWKFTIDASGTVTVANGGAPLFIALDAGGNRQPITGTVDAGLHHISGQIVVFGTGKYFEVGDNLAGSFAQIQSFYGIWDKNDGSSTTRGQLQAQTMGETTVGGRLVRTLTNNAINWITQRGWYFDLRVGGAAGQGERAIGRPTVQLGGVLFTTYSPIGDICNPGGISRVYVTSIQSGGPDLNLTGCPNCASLDIGTGSPNRDPRVVSENQEPGGRQGFEAPPHVGGGGELIDPAPAAGCAVVLGVITPDGFVRYKTVSCGRQSWRQLQ